MVLKNLPVAIDSADPTIGVDVEIPSGTPLASISIGNLVGDLALSLTLSALDGETVSLYSYHGRVVILYFWNPNQWWLDYCMSHVCELWKDHEDVGVVLLVGSLDRDEADLMSIIEASSCPGFLPLSETYTAASNSARHYGDGGLPCRPSW